MTARSDNGDSRKIRAELKAPLIISVAFHFLIGSVSTLGIPFLARDIPDIINTPITVELIAPKDDKTQTPKPAAQKEEKKPAPKQMTADAPPDLTKLEPPLTEPDLQDSEVAKSLPEPEAIPDPSKKPEAPPKKKPDPKATKVEAKPKAKDFSSILKNLTPDAETKENKPALERLLTDETGQNAPLGEKLSVNELDTLRQHIQPCWNVPAGAKYAEDLVIEIRAFMNPDGTVQRTVILDKSRYNREPHFRAAAESAQRALRNPRCSPLPLPSGKYEQWKTIVMTFDPRDML